MQNPVTKASIRKRSAIGMIVAAASTLLAVFLIPMTSANAAPDGDHMVIDGCTIDLPFGYGYEANGSPIDAGPQELVSFYPGATIEQFDGPDVVEEIDFDVPLDCAVTVTATCDTVTFHTYLGADWWSVLRVDYGNEDEQLGEEYFTSNTISVPLDDSPFYYVVVDEEMDNGFEGRLAPDCSTADTPTVAPASGV